MKTMSEKDLVERGDVFNAFCNHSEVVIHNGKPSFVVNYPNVIRSIPAVSQEMSASEYLKERTRMEAWSAENCNQASLDCDDECCECPYDQVPDCKDEANRPLEAIAIVEKWAKEHQRR